MGQITLRRWVLGVMGVVGLTAAIAGAPARVLANEPVAIFQRLRYEDSDGPGVLEITAGERDDATGGFKTTVRLTQNGWVFTGSGFRLRLFTPPPNSADMQTIDLVVFTLRDSFGRSFIFRGQIREGGIFYRIEGGGKYERAGSGVDSDTWRVSDR